MIKDEINSCVQIIYNNKKNVLFWIWNFIFLFCFSFIWKYYILLFFIINILILFCFFFIKNYSITINNNNILQLIWAELQLSLLFSLQTSINIKILILLCNNFIFRFLFYNLFGFAFKIFKTSLLLFESFKKEFYAKDINKKKKNFHIIYHYITKSMYYYIYDNVIKIHSLNQEYEITFLRIKRKIKINIIKKNAK